MKHHHRFETASPNQRVQIEALIYSLGRYVDLLNVDIETQEQSVRATRTDEPNYSPPARNLRARRDNLVATIELLQRRLPSPSLARAARGPFPGAPAGRVGYEDLADPP